jgi:DNA-binding winged helix-turn-helix (wHTH) protein/tetratricopeptide (TPR) repeat protein
VIDSTARRNPSAGCFEFGPFKLEISTRSLYRGDAFVPVTPKALDTLFVLVEAAGRLVTKDELMQKVWPDAYVEEGSIANNISMLRKILNPFFEGDGPIATVARRGYRFTEPVHLRNAIAPISIVHVASNTTRTVVTSAAIGVIAATVALALFLRPTPSEAPQPSSTEVAQPAMSSNPEALRSYRLGLEALRNHDMKRSTELLSEATHADPGFALAHSTLSIAWRVLGHDDKSQAAAKIALELASRLGREDQLAVQGAYYEVMADLPRAIEKYQSLWNFFPENPAYGLKLVHQQLLGGRLDDARRTLDQMRALPPPSDTDPRFDQVEADWFMRQGRFADAVAVTAQGIEHAKLRNSRQLQARLTLMQGRAELRLGDNSRARGLFKDAQQLFESLGDQAGVADVLRADGIALASRGDLAEGKRCLDRALQVATSISHQRMIPGILAERAELMQKMTPAADDR